MFLNYQASPTYRSYKYLHGRPCQVILHCLDRKSNSRKYSEEDLLSRDSMKGIFTIAGSSGKVHTVDFGQETEQPACTCPDWHFPCKHFFSIFRMVEGWDWESLPKSYKSSPRLTATHSQDHLKWMQRLSMTQPFLTRFRMILHCHKTLHCYRICQQKKVK